MPKKFLKNSFFLFSCFFLLFSSIENTFANTWYFTTENHNTLGSSYKWLKNSFTGSSTDYLINSKFTGETIFNNGSSSQRWAITTYSNNVTIPAGVWTFAISGKNESNKDWFPRIKIYNSNGTLIHTSTSPTGFTNGTYTTISWTDSIPAFSVGTGHYYSVEVYSFRNTKGNKDDYFRIENILLSYITDPTSYKPYSRAWRFYDDHLSLTPSVPYAGEQATPTGMYNHNNIRLRETIAEIGGSSQTGRKKLRFSSDAVNFTDVGEIGSGAVWAYCNGGGTDNNLVPSLLLSTSSTFGPFVESGTAASSYNHEANQSAEFDFCLQENMALTNTTYFFQLIDVASGAIIYPDATYNWPNITIGTHGMILEVEPSFDLAEINLNDAPGPTTGTFSNMYIHDHTGALGGWSITATATDFISGTDIITIDNLTMTSDSISPLLAESIFGINLGSGTLSNSTPLNIANASSGNGAGNFSVSGNFSLYIPIATAPGTYTSTMTITIS